MEKGFETLLYLRNSKLAPPLARAVTLIDESGIIDGTVYFI